MDTSSDDLDTELLRLANAVLQSNGHNVVANTLAELRQRIHERIADSPSSGRVLGPMLGRLNAVQQQTSLPSDTLHWVTVGAGRLAVGHRPKLRSFGKLRDEGCTHLLTLLSAREGAEVIGKGAKRAGIEWIWFPLANGDLPEPSRDNEAVDLLNELNGKLDSGAGLYIHCSAGIHRTGMVTFALLRSRGYSSAEGIATLRELRNDTAEGVGSDRLTWAARLLDAKTSSSSGQCSPLG